MVAFQKLQIPASNKALSEWCMHVAVMATVVLLLLSPSCTCSIDCVYLTPVEGKELVNQSTNLPCCLYAAGRARYMLTWQMHTTAFKVRPPGSPGRDPSLVDLLACPLPDHTTKCNFVGDLLWQNNWTSMSSCYVRAKVCKCGVTKLVLSPQMAITPSASF